MSSDFGPGNIGCGAMEAVIFEICPEAKVIHFCHAIPGFDIKDGAKMLEGVAKIPKGIHVCVVDPGVGTKRRGVILETKRGDFLVGPDNGVLVTAADFLGGIVASYSLANEKYQRHPVSPIFHGRDIFAPAAGHLAKGVAPEQFGPQLDLKDLVPAPYPEAKWESNEIKCEVIHINEQGSLFLNIRAEEFLKKLEFGDLARLHLRDEKINLKVKKVFGEIPKGEALILPDDFGRVEVAINQGNFAFTFDVKRGERLSVMKEG